MASITPYLEAYNALVEEQLLGPWGFEKGSHASQAVAYGLPVAAATASAALLLWGSRALAVAAFDWVASARAGDKNPGAVFLSANYAPVEDERAEANLPVEGVVPSDLEGAFLRIGPNPKFTPAGAYHWFDGDGMLHGVRIKGGRAAYANHYVRTARLEVEEAAGRPLYMKLGDICGKRGLLLLLLNTLKEKLGVLPRGKGAGVANTALVFHARRLLALHEGDLPYAVRVACDGLIETLGRLTVAGPGGVAYPGPFTAHPKVDPVTGELFFFGYSFDKPPYVRAGLMDAAGSVMKQWAVHTPYPAMMHDCGLTKHYAVLLHMPLKFDGKVMVEKDTLPLAFDAKLPARIGLLRRDAPGATRHVEDPKAEAAPVQWFEFPACFVFHVANAWEDDAGRVHLVACTFPEFDFAFNAPTNEPPPESQRQRPVEFVLDPATGEGTQVQLSPVGCDFPVVHPGLTAARTRYMWGATFNYATEGANVVEATGVAKYDLGRAGKDACVGQIKYPAGTFGGEAFYVPRHADPKHGAEDDGWLLVYVHDTTTDKSSLNIYDARNMSSTPLARIKLPRRVPYGFHSLFVREEQLQEQLKKH